jgi:hypothetical protein
VPALPRTRSLLTLALALAAAAALLWAAWPAPRARQQARLEAGAPALAGSGPATRLTGGGLAIEVEAPRRLRAGEAGQACVRVSSLSDAGQELALEGLPAGATLSLLVGLQAAGLEVDPLAEQGGPLPTTGPLAACWALRAPHAPQAALEFTLRLRALTPEGADEWLFWTAQQRVDRTHLMGLGRPAAYVVGVVCAALALALRHGDQERDRRWTHPHKRSRS